MTKTPKMQPAIRIIAMPADTNAAGDIFGGWIISMMDLAAGNVASRRCRGRAVTVAIDAVSFHRPVRVGNEISVYAEVVSVGRTSMKIDVQAWQRDQTGDRMDKVTQATFTFVAVDKAGTPKPIEPDEPA
jgi:acyl-CoA thioesterase YciA